MGRPYSLKLRRRLLSAMVGCAVLLAAGDAAALGLMQAYQAALQHDPTYQSAIHDHEAGQENRILGRSYLLPNISANYSNSHNRTDITEFDQLGHTAGSHPVYDSHVAEISLRQPLFSMEAWARYKQGQAQADYSSATFAQRQQELILRVAGAYTDVLNATEQLHSYEAQRDYYAEQQKVNSLLFEKGEGTRTDVLETQSRLDLSQAQVLEAQDVLSTAKTTLAGIVGDEVGGIDDIDPNFQVMPTPADTFETWKETALRLNPEIAAQRFAIEASHQEVNKSRSGHTPRLDFIASYSKNASDTINTYNQDSTVRAIGIQLNVPLYAGGSVSAATRQAVAGEEKAKSDLQATTDKVLVELRKQYTAVLSSVARIHAMEKSVESSNLLITATKQSIKGGVRINLDLLNAQQQMFTNRRDLAQARYNYLLSMLKLRAAAGMLDEDALHVVAAFFH